MGMQGRNKEVLCEARSVVFCLLHAKSAFFEMRFLISIPKIPLFLSFAGSEDGRMGVRVGVAFCNQG